MQPIAVLIPVSSSLHLTLESTFSVVPPVVSEVPGVGGVVGTDALHSEARSQQYDPQVTRPAEQEPLGGFELQSADAD